MTVGKHTVEHIACITDLSDATLPAFHHALALALACRAKLTLLHISPAHRDDIAWERFPRVRETLQQWGRLAPDSDHTSVVEQLGVDVHKQAFRDQSLVHGLQAFMQQHHTDLVVSCLPRRGWWRRCCRTAGVERLIRSHITHMLLLPEGTRPLLDANDGSGRLARVLFPVAATPDPGSALRLCEHLLPALAGPRPQVTLFHLGTRDSAPELTPAAGPLAWHWRYASGGVVRQILASAEQDDSDLLVMPSAGRVGLWQVLRRSVTEQVLRRSRRPLLVLAGD